MIQLLMVVDEGEHWVLVNPDQICIVKNEGKLTKVYTTNGSILVKETVKQVQERIEAAWR